MFEAIREQLDDDEYLEPETIEMKGMDSVVVTVGVTWFPDDDIDSLEEYIEGRRLEILELLHGDVNLTILMA